MARNWDGVNDVIRYAAGAGIDDLSLGAFSIHAWINADTVGEANTGRILDKDDTTGTQGGWLFFTDATASLGFITVDSGGGVEAHQRGVDDAITLGTWHSVVVTYDNDGDRKGHIYVDGSEIGYDTDDAAGAGQNSGDSGVPLAIGNRADALVRDFDGEICEVACWSRVISAAEIAALANGFAPLFFLNSLGFYAPLIRGANDYFGHAATVTNTTVTPHPSIIRPTSPRMAVALGGAAAADGTIYKTWDRFTTVGRLRPATGYPAAPAGGKAKMNAIGRRVLLADVDERVLAIASDGGTPKETALLGAGSAWTAPDVVGAGLGIAPRIYPLTDQLWFAVNGTGTAQQASGPGRRTEDGGGTWGDTPDPRPAGNGVVQFARDVGGRVWCVVFHSTTSNAYVYWSDDDGDTWNLSRTIQDGLLDAVWKIMPHPSDQNILAVISYNTVPSEGSINYTLNRGSTWAANTDIELRRGSTTLRYDAVLLSNNRIVAIGPLNDAGASSPSRAIYSDDWGANWSVAFSVIGGNVRFSNLFVNPGGTRLGFVYVEDRTASPGDWHLALSTNGGSAFNVTALAVELETLWTTDVDNDGFLSTMSPERDALYCILRKGPNSQAFRLTPISAAGVWADITTDLDQALDYNTKGMAVIPRVGA